MSVYSSVTDVCLTWSLLDVYLSYGLIVFARLRHTGKVTAYILSFLTAQFNAAYIAHFHSLGTNVVMCTGNTKLYFRSLTLEVSDVSVLHKDSVRTSLSPSVKKSRSGV
jgi:hypothetical protein